MDWNLRYLLGLLLLDLFENVFESTVALIVKISIAYIYNEHALHDHLLLNIDR